MTKDQRGFTLVELLVVIAIIGVLSSIILGALNTARAYGRDAQRQAALTQIQEALENYASDHNGAYPAGSYVSMCAAWNSGGTLNATNMIPGLVPGYLPTIPQDPSMIASANQDCIIYVSDTVNYKVLDYNIADSQNPGAQPTLVDPVRNIGRKWANSTACSGANPFNDTSASWAVWSSKTSECGW